jgi:hypothetical protein
MIYERYHTRDLNHYGGMASRMPVYAVFLVFFVLSSAGLPGLNGFIGEVLCLFGIGQFELDYRGKLVLTACAVSGMVLGAWYLFTMLQRLLFGPVKEPHGETSDLKPREWLLLAPLAVLCLVLGMYPQPVLDAIQPEVDMIAKIAETARQRAGVEPKRSQTSRRGEAGENQRPRMTRITRIIKEQMGREGPEEPQTDSRRMLPSLVGRREPLRWPGLPAPFMGLPAQRFRPAVDGGRQACFPC